MAVRCSAASRAQADSTEDPVVHDPRRGMRHYPMCSLIFMLLAAAVHGSLLLLLHGKATRST